MMIDREDSPRTQAVLNNRLLRSHLSLISIGVITLGIITPPAFGALTQRDLENKIKEAKVLRNGERISLTTREEECTIHKFRAPESTDTEKDCKIDAVLIARVVMNSDSSIKKVRVRFFEPNDPSKYSEVLVGLPAIKAFGMGALSHADLLASLDVTHGVDNSQLQQQASSTAAATQTATAGDSKADVSASDEVVDGPYKEERSKLLEQIKELQKRKINTQAYTELFGLMEATAKTGDKAAVSEKLDRLTQAVNSQMKALSQQGKHALANKAAAGAALNYDAPAQSIDPSTMSAEEKMKLLMYKQSKMLYGDFIAVPGPNESDRGLITHVVLSKKKQGYNVDQDKRMIQDLNALATKGDRANLVKKINAAFVYLHISQDDVIAWKKQYKRQQDWTNSLTRFSQQ